MQEPYLKSSGIQEPLYEGAFKMLFFSSAEEYCS